MRRVLHFTESFGWILLNSEFICIIGIVLTYLGIWGKRVNFGNIVVEIQQKYEREREKMGERKFWISVMWLPKFLLPEPLARAQKRNQLWQCHCRNRGRKKNCSNCGNAIAKNGREKKNSGCPNHIWGIKKKKKSTTSIIFLQHFYNKSQVISYY